MRRKKGEFMKKIMRRINFALVAMMAAPISAFAASDGTVLSMNRTVCELATQFGAVFKGLRLLAFIGAGFILASWAWTYISKGEAKLEDVKTKGMGMLIGFAMLFLVGIILSAFITMTGGDNCVANSFS